MEGKRRGRGGRRRGREKERVLLHYMKMGDLPSGRSEKVPERRLLCVTDIRAQVENRE